IDENGIGIGDIQARFNDCCCQKHIIIAAYEIRHDVLYLITLHAAMYNGNLYLRTEVEQGGFHLHNVFYPVVDEENLPVTANLVNYSLADNILIEAVKLGDDGHPVGGRSADH